MISFPRKLSGLLPVLITFFMTGCVVHADSTVDLSIEQETTFGQSVFVSADHPMFGSGDVTRAVKLSPNNYPTWTLQADLPDNLDLEFSYLLRNDSPDQLGDANNGTVVSTRQVTTVETSEQTPSLPEPPDGVTNPRRETFPFTPTGFPERTITVLLPRGYDQNSEKHYPVIYLQDGQNVFSPGGPFGSWDADITITDMIARAELPEVIAVAIDNTNIRHVEYTPSYGEVFGQQGRGEEFLTALRDELVLEINGRYRTRTEPEFTVHVGSSLGGLLGYHAAFNFSETFGSIIAMSPSSQIATDTLQTLTQTPPENAARLYMDSGNGGGSNDGYSNTVGLRDALLVNDYIYGPEFFFAVGLGQQHNEAAWRTRLPDALRWWAGPVIEQLVQSPTADSWKVN